MVESQIANAQSVPESTGFVSAGKANIIGDHTLQSKFTFLCGLGFGALLKPNF
jgi:hypothetical protein